MVTKANSMNIASYGKAFCNARLSQKMKDPASDNKDKYITPKESE
jgi:hypothetical protein